MRESEISKGNRLKKKKRKKVARVLRKSEPYTKTLTDHERGRERETERQRDRETERDRERERAAGRERENGRGRTRNTINKLSRTVTYE